VGTGGVYVEREADIRLRRELSDNRRFPLLSAPPESGKTSLIRHTIESLDPAGFCALTVDLSRLRPGSPTQFVGDLLAAIAKEGDFDQREILPDTPEDTILAWLGTFPQRLLLFLDGCEVLGRSEICEATFGKLRLLFNIRNENEEFSRLQVFLAGAVTGRRLIPAHLQGPFGVGVEIQLRPFNAEQVDALAWHLSTTGSAVGADVGSRLTHHSGGLPFLCQQVLSSLWEDSVSKGTTIDIADVDRAVDDLIERAPQIEHFANMFRLLTGDQDLLDAFHRLCRGQAVSDEMLHSLTMTGLCDEELPYRSSIYERVFATGGPLALPGPVGQRPTRPIEIISLTPPSDAWVGPEKSETIEVNPDEDSGFQVLSEPPPPKKPEPSPQVGKIESVPVENAQLSVSSAHAAATVSSPALVHVETSGQTPTYGVAKPSEGEGSTRTPTYTAPQSVQAAASSHRTPTYSSEPKPIAVPSERTPPYASSSNAPPSASTPKYPGTTGSMPMIPADSMDAVEQASTKTPMYNLSMTPPVPSQRTPTYPMPGMGATAGGLEARLAGSETGRDGLDDFPTQLQPSVTRSETQELRDLIDEQILLSAELDLFCNTFFPQVARLFNSPLSRAEKTDLVLAHVDRAVLRQRLKDWEKRRREERPEAYSSPLVNAVETTDAVEMIEMIETIEPVEDTRPGPVASSMAAAQNAVASPPQVAPPVSSLGTDKEGAAQAGTRAESPAAVSVPAEKPTSDEIATGYKPPQAATLQVGIGLVLANRYFLTSELGQGVAATMWNAYDRIKDEQVALKILHGRAAENPQLVERFWRSAQQMSGLSHPTIVTVLNKPREENSIHYVVYELQTGGNLRQWVQSGKITRVQLMRALQRLAAALTYAHDKKAFHRDIKPTNILFDGAGHARLTDFAMVWPADAAQKIESRTDRTVYMAPEEQAGGHLGDARSDVYSLGMCALYALLGKELTPTMAMERANLIEQLDAPPPLKAVLLRAVAPNPNDRFPSVADFSRALEFDAPALPGMVTRSSIPGSLSRTNPGLLAPGVRQSSPQLPVMAPLSRTNPPINPSLTRTNPGLFGGTAPPLTSPARPVPVRSTGPQPVAGLRTTNPPASTGLRTTNPPPAANLRNTNPPMPGLTRTLPPAMLTPAADEEIQPPPGRNPLALAEYAIDTERVRAVTAEAIGTRNPDSVMQPLPQPPVQRQWPLLLGFGALVLVGGVALGTVLVNVTRKPVVATNDPPNVKDAPLLAGGSAPIRPVEPSEFVATPIIPVKPGEVLPTKHKTEAKAHLAQTATKGGAKTDADTPKHADQKSALLAKAGAAGAGNEGAEKVPVRPALLKGAAAKTEPAKPSESKSLLAKAEKSTAVKSIETPTETAKVIAVVKAAASAKVDPAKMAAAKVDPAKMAAAKVDPAKVAAAKVDPAKVAAAKVDPAKMAAAKVDPAKMAAAKAAPNKYASAAKPVPAFRPAPYKPAVAAARPAPVAVTSPEAQAALREAQQVFIRGERAKALAMALAVTRRGGEDAASAWRFVGGAACSTRQAAMATTAYRNLKAPESRRTLVDLCQRNGVPFAGGQFSSD
jgi:serine/threonine protein kinase